MYNICYIKTHSNKTRLNLKFLSIDLRCSLLGVYHNRVVKLQDVVHLIRLIICVKGLGNLN